MIGHLLYLLISASLLLSVPSDTYLSASRLFVVVGAIGLWRYSWAAVNLVRAVWYQRIAFPKIRKTAERRFQKNSSAKHTFFLITTFGIETAVTIRVYRALFEAAQNGPNGATIVASVVDMADQRLIQSIFTGIGEGYKGVRLEFVRIPGTGKRDALACGLAAIKAYRPSSQDIVIFVDGDSCVPIDIIEKSAPFFMLDSQVGALTTDELCEPKGSQTFQDWYALRFAQRQMMMCSLGLSRRVLTLTGRMSVFRGDVATDAGFIECVRNDEIEHWRLGAVKFLTGDDKSTWYWLLKNGYQMLYLPDVQSISMEQAPKPGFVESASILMVRWFGNMLRNNSRAIRLSPAKIGHFTWWSILDQRISMWTTLTGPISALLGAIFIDPIIAVAYVGWVMASRYIYCLSLMLFRPEFKITYPFIVYFNQVYGSFLKTWVFFRLDRQRWTRQTTVAARNNSSVTPRLKRFSSIYMHALSFSLLFTLVSLMGGLITLS